MRPRYFFVTIAFGAVFAVILVLQASCSIPPSTVSQINSSPEVRNALVERVEVQVDDGALISAKTEAVAPQATPMQDGLELLEAHCAQCHVTAWLDQIEKPRTKWEEALAQMEAMGVQLSDTEKDALLNYLAVADKP